ncbi:MAG: GlsB/YeaQ/YmgE family stress response membrane protein [Rhodothermaceae bacterium]|nr:GlsB/YeaQ/YmgE family stress response membrane protein [Rhodothermaceae bacterium]
MGILAWIVIGIIAGWLAEQIMKSSMGLPMNLLVGVIGAFVGGFVFNLFGGAGVTGFNLYSILVATVGAVLLLWVVGLVKK